MTSIDLDQLMQLLASGQGRRDEIPNQMLAKSIAAQGDKQAVAGLVSLLDHKRNAVQNDAIKTLYEIGALHPHLLAPHRDVFLRILKQKNNRLQWGAMTALQTIAEVDPAGIYNHLGTILEVADNGSVITRDQAVMILIRLASIPDYHTTAIVLLLEQLSRAPENQLPMYAERSLPILQLADCQEFIQVLTSRWPAMTSPTKKKRVEKVITQLHKRFNL
ncbi:MAG: hypothetical protein KDC57_05475 [Saprospiraceae bacterium]|nr:hypothetical protein [Saprospiraceae bacterium]